MSRDSIALRRRQIELDDSFARSARLRHVQVVIPVRHRAQRETNQKARDSNQEAEPDIRPSWQDRSLSVASPAPTGRLSFRKSCSTRVPRTRHLRTLSACASKDTPHWSRTQISPQPRPSGAIDSAATPRATPMQIARPVCQRKLATRGSRYSRAPAVPSRRAGPAPSARRRETHGRTSRIPSDVPAARRAAPPSAVLRHSAGNSCRASKQFITVTCCDPLRASAPPACAAPVARGTREFLPWPHSIPASRRFR